MRGDANVGTFGNGTFKLSATRASVHTKSEKRLMWDPFWLRTAWLGAYALLFGLLAATTLALYIVSDEINGLGTLKSTTATVYFWKYCPTAILVAVLALWNPVDYFTRLLQPWANLSKGFAPASRTLLLDLVSPLQPMIMFSAAKNREWPVVITSSVAIALTVVKVVSTGLLVIQPTSIAVDGATFVKTAVFDASLWNSSDPTSGESISLYNGIEQENLTRPAWTGDNFVVEPFKLPEDKAALSNSTYTAVTRGIYPGLDCDEAKFKGEPTYYNISVGIRRANVTYHTSTCEAQATLLLADSTQVSMRQNKWAAENYVGDVGVVTCSGRRSFLITVTQANRNLEVTNYSALICRPFYHLQNVTVKIDDHGQQHYEHLAAADPPDIQIDHLDPTVAFSFVVNASQTSGARLPWVQPSGDITEANFPFLTLVAIRFTNSNPGSSYLRPLLDVSTLKSSVTATFSGILSLLVSQQMLRPTAESINGNLHYLEDRLHVQKTPSLVITVVLLSCFSFAVVLLFVSPKKVVPFNPNSIDGIATILGPIRDMEMLGKTSLEAVVQNTRKQNFKSLVYTQEDLSSRECNFDIISVEETTEQLSNNNHDRSEQLSRNWCPFTLYLWVKASAVAICLAIIVALELLQKKSDRFDGISRVSSSSNAQFWATVIPAVVLIGLALLYSSIHFNTAILAPYHALTSNAGATAKRSISTKYLGSTPLFTIPPAVHKRHVATWTSAFAAVVGAFLSIVVSGLYTVQLSSVTYDVEVQRSDKWNLTWPLTENDGSAGQALQFIIWKNLSQPQWTYDDLVLPVISLPKTSTGAINQEKLTVTLPARRAVLECATTRPIDNKVSISSGFTTIFSNVTNTCSGKTGEDLPLRITVSRPLASYGGNLMQLLFDPRGTSAQALVPNSKYPSSNPDNSSCPSLAMIFGSFPDSAPAQTNTNSSTFSPPLRNLTSSEASVTVLACTQFLYELDVSVSFLLPQLTLDPVNPIVRNEASARRIGGIYQFPIVSPLGSTFGVISTNTTFKNDISNRLGSFFAAIVYGKDGIPASELVGEENVSRLTSAVSKMYGKYMALVMARRMRSPEPSETAQNFRASMLQTEERLVQNPRAKIALQVLLGTMMLCGIISWATMLNVKILPHSPCSIAGTACLLAGREFWGGRQSAWDEDEVFKLRMGRDKRCGIHAVDKERENLVS